MLSLPKHLYRIVWMLFGRDASASSA